MLLDQDPFLKDQANRIVLGISTFGVAEYLEGLTSLDRELVGASFGVKMPKGTNVRVDDTSDDATNTHYHYRSPIDLALTAAEAGASQLIIDGKEGHEGKELEAVVDDFLFNLSVEGVRSTLRERQTMLERTSRFLDDIVGGAVDPDYARFTELEKSLGPERMADIFPPNILTIAISTHTDPEELAVVREHAASQGAILVAIVGSSKKPLSQYERYDQDPVVESTKLARIALDAEIWDLQLPAIDAHPLRDSLSKWFDTNRIVITGTGVYTYGYSTSDHKRTIRIEDSVGVDRFLLGAPILLTEDQNQAYMDHLRAMPPKDK